MFFKRKRYAIHDQLDMFCYERRYFTTTRKHREWILQLIKVTGVKSVSDILQEDVKAFIEAVGDTRTPFTVTSAASALRIFMAFVKKNDILLSSHMIKEKKVGRPKNDELRKKINMYLKKGLTVRQVSKLVEVPKSNVQYYKS